MAYRINMKMKGEELLQKNCIRWFRLQYPHLTMLMFAIPNGGLRNKRIAVKLKQTGVVAGVADLFFSMSDGTHHGMYIELKYGKNRPTEHQLAFKRAVESAGYLWHEINNFDDFRSVVNDYVAKMENRR